MTLKELLESGYEAKASDIHVMPGRPAMFRINGTISAYGSSGIEVNEMEKMLQMLLTEAQMEELEQYKEIETAVTLFGWFRIRINVFSQRESYCASIRLLSSVIPTPRELFLPPEFLALAKEKKGLIFIAGESGSGKSTTAASLLNEISVCETKHIMTLERPIEYLLTHGKGLMSQKEMDGNEEAYADAVKAAVRQDADVIFIGNIFDAETISEAVLAAESGRLVVAALSAPSAVDALENIVQRFYSFRREEMQRRIANVLKGIIVPRLLPVCGAKERRAVYEVLLEDKEIRMLIREGRFSQISSVMEKNRDLGMQTMDDAILSAYMKSVISSETAVEFASDREKMLRRMKIY